jgi:DNA polymerase elongation subunit (family B)
LNARQFGLKMIANVSYGYTSASFSGRMPFAELADAIVQVGGNGTTKHQRTWLGATNISATE